MSSVAPDESGRSVGVEVKEVGRYTDKSIKAPGFYQNRKAKTLSGISNNAKRKGC